MTTEVIYRLHDVGVKGQGQFFIDPPAKWHLNGVSLAGR